MSELSVGSLSGLAANSYVIDVASGSSLDLSNGAVLPAGSILQVVQGTDATSTNTTSTSYADTGLSASITPSSATSKVLVLVTEQIRGASSSLTDFSGFIALMKGATQLTEHEIRIKAAASGGELVNSQVINMCYLDSPASTSALTYKTQSKTSNASATIATDFAGTSTITLMEVAA